MNFIRALDKARKNEVTKDEFLHVWEAESKLHPGNETPGSVSEVCQKPNVQAITSDHSSQQWQHVQEELKEMLSSKMQSLLNQHIDQQEQKWQELRTIITQNAELFQAQFGIVCQHISSVMESEMSSLKLYFMQELEIMKQGLEKMIEDRYSRYETGIATSAPTWQSAVGNSNHESGKNHKSTFDIKKDRQDYGLPSGINQAAKFVPRDEAKQDIHSEDSLPDSTCDWHKQTWDETPLLKVTEAKTCDNKKTFGAVGNIRKDISKNETHLNTVRSFSPTISAMSLNEQPTTATGFYADIISRQIKRDKSQTSSDTSVASSKGKQKKKQETKNYFTYKTQSAASLTNFKDMYWQIFSIDDIAIFSYPGKLYYGPFLYPGTNAWKVRLCVGFNKKRQLQVSVCVTKGDSEGHSKWPVDITSNGFIYHENSKQFTQIWAQGWVTCHKPMNSEKCFPAKICLATSRGSHPDVTFNELEDKCYLRDNKALFKWNFKVRTS